MIFLWSTFVILIIAVLLILAGKNGIDGQCFAIGLCIIGFLAALPINPGFVIRILNNILKRGKNGR